MVILINIIGFIFIWIATDVGRTEDSKIALFDKNWWTIITLLIISSYLVGYNG